jgi:hypothetical protein
MRSAVVLMPSCRSLEFDMRPWRFADGDRGVLALASTFGTFLENTTAMRFCSHNFSLEWKDGA